MVRAAQVLRTRAVPPSWRMLAQVNTGFGDRATLLLIYSRETRDLKIIILLYYVKLTVVLILF